MRWNLKEAVGDPNDASTFTMIAEQTLTTSYPEEPFEYIIPTNSTDSRWSEEVIFETASACQTPDGLGAVATINSAIISWNGYGQETFNLRYNTDGENWTTVTGVNNPYTLQSLLASTIYNVQVQPTCADENTWSATYIFTTLCGAVTTFPWEVGFEQGVLSCWEQDGNGTWTVGTGDYGGNLDAHTGTHNAKITHGTNGNVTKLITPVLDLTSLNNPALTFWYINRI